MKGRVIVDLKTYEKTRYQNIYRHKKNKNYMIMISKPSKTSISRIDGKKIEKLEDALKIRDNPKIKFQKGNEAMYKENFDDVWEKYIEACVVEKRLAYNTLTRKNKTYNKYIKGEFPKRLSKIVQKDIIDHLKSIKCSDKQKNQVLKELKAFFNWCIGKEYIIMSPIINIKPIKQAKVEMRYWTPEELKRFLECLENAIIWAKENNYIKKLIKIRRVKIFTLIEFCLGDRVGETRALRYISFDELTTTAEINHSINYDRKSDDFLSLTKTYQSQRVVDVTDRLIYEVNDYKQFLKDNTKYKVSNNDLIFFNYERNAPLSDTTLRKDFHEYCEKANVKKIRMYDLRHTYVATMMSEGKELYHISSRIGHNSYSTTVDKYGYLSNKTRKEIAKITDKYI